MIICLLIPLGAASASDVNNTAADDQVLSATPNVDTLSAGVNLEQENDTLSVQENEILSAGQDSGSDNLLGDDGETENYRSFSDLVTLIKISDQTLYLNDNFKYDSTTDDAYKNGIEINKPITIDGNNKIIDGNNQLSLFTVNSNDVIIKNLFIQNFRVSGSERMGVITWNGNNGQLINTTLTNSEITGNLQGIIYYEGDDGLISNCTFSNLKRSGSGADSASIEVQAKNLRIEHSVFTGSQAYLAIESGQGSNNTQVYKCEFKSISTTALIWSRRGGITLDYCNFTDINASSVLFDFRAYDKVYHSIIDGCNINYFVSYGFLFDYVIIQNSNLTNFDSAGLFGSILNHTQFINNTFKATNYYFNSPYYMIDYCLFENNTGKIWNGNYKNGLLLNNTQFINNNAGNTSGLLTFNQNSDKIVINNCTFKRNYGYTNSVVYNTTNEGYGHFIINDNIFTDNRNSSDGNLDYNSELTSFDSYPIVYVNETGGGSGHYTNDRTTLDEALLLADNGATIYVAPGVYTLNSRKNIYASIIGEGDNVFINDYGFYFSYHNIICKNIIFNNTKQALSIGNYYITIENCTFQTKNKIRIIDTYMGYYSYKGSKIIDCKLLNSTITNFIGETSIECLTVENIDIINSTLDKFVLCGTNYLSKYNKINVYNSKVTNSFFDYAGSTNGNLWRYDTISNVFINNTTFGSRVICLRDNVAANQNTIENLTIKNSTMTSAVAVIYVGHGTSIKNITITDLVAPSKGINVISGIKTDNIVDTITLNNVSNIQYVLRPGIDGAFKSYDRISINKANVFNALPSVKNMGDLNITITNTNFTSNITVDLVDGMNLVNSKFENYSGHVIASGNNIKITKTDFIGGNNSELNGSALVINGNFIKVSDCKFTGNNASLGGAVFIVNTSAKPVFSDCNFMKNNASLGGAIYIDQDPSEGFFIGLTGNTNNTILYPNKEGWVNTGFNDLYGFPSQLLDKVFVINETNGRGSGSGEDWYNAAPLLKALSAVTNNAVITFVRAGDIFDMQTMDFTIVDDGLIFKGNESVINNIHWIVNADNVEFYNITFSNVSNGAMILNGEKSTVWNCSFENNGGDTVIKGGAMQVNGNNTRIYNSTFIGNNAIEEDTGGIGGALYINASNITIDSCTFENNTIYDTGAHIYVETGNEYVIIDKSRFIGGFYTGSGHASGVLVQGINMKVTNSNFTKNSGKDGSALYVNGNVPNLNVAYNNFEENTATNGALYLSFSDNLNTNKYILNNNFTRNNGENGGAIFIDAPTVSDNLEFNNNFTSNDAKNGGAIYINTPFVLENALFESNNAILGGAVYVNSTGVVIKNSDFYSNTALDSESMGSAVYVAESAYCDFYNVRLNNNHVYGEDNPETQYGLRGDIYFALTSGFMDITWGDSPYKQYYAINTNYKAKYIYVNMTSEGRGLTSSDVRSNLTEALKHIVPNGQIIFCDEDYEITLDLLNKIRDANLTNVSFVGNGNIVIKRANDNTNKYLFNHPKKIKNLSLNNYLSTKNSKK